MNAIPEQLPPIEAQRIALAKWDGFEIMARLPHRLKPMGRKHPFDWVILPDYGADLNAVALVVARLTAEQHQEYREHLRGMMASHEWQAIDATAAQRLAALCRTLGICKEE